jgi:MarR family transcriptional regulator, organic hydroperoxide resistance regulator
MTWAILVDGRDDQFRATLDDLLTFAMRLQQVREALAKRIKLSPPQYNILMILAHTGQAGITISQMAERLRVSVPFVVQETGRLEQAGLVAKIPDADDKRRVILELTSQSRKLLTEIAPLQVEVNDVLFSELSRSDFGLLGKIARRLVVSCGEGLALSKSRP